MSVNEVRKIPLIEQYALSVLLSETIAMVNYVSLM